MSYTHTDRRSDLNIKQDDLLASKRFVIERKPDSSYFYELEEAVVLDVILDEEHPEFSNTEIDAVDSPPNIDGSEPVIGEKDYSLIGRIKFRFLNSERGKDKEQLSWAFPMENTGITEYPLMNEVVIIGKYLNKYFYTKKLNSKSVVNSNASFITERVSGFVEQNTNEYTGKEYTGPKSTMNFSGGENYTGVLGNYFKFNHHIRALKRYEGDTILESRFGSSIRFGAYDDNRKNDGGVGGEYKDGAGNPMILFRNRQAPIKNVQGFTAKGYTTEDINNDGSSIHFTSGKTISKFVPTVRNPIIYGTLPTQIPKFDGDQIVINSDRLVFSSKANEMFFFSKKKIGMTSDDAICISCADRITLTALKTTTINSPKIYLGDHGKPYEPALLGRTSIAWMYSLCDWMLLNVNSQMQTVGLIMAHFHTSPKDIGNVPNPVFITLLAEQFASLQASQISLLALRSQLGTLMSSRVFVSGGVD